MVQAEGKEREVRYRLLETIRQYARERLFESRESETVRTRHLDFFTHLAERAEPELEGQGALEWLDTLNTDLDNVRGALDWSVASKQAEKGLRLITALTIFWPGRWTESRVWYERLLAEEITDPALRGKALVGAAQSTFLSDLAAGRTLAEQALGLGREVGDGKLIARALQALGFVALLEGDLPGGRPLLEESVAVGREASDPFSVVEALV